MSTTEPEVRGLRPYGFDWVVKFGGSLLATPDITRQAVAGVEAASASGFRLLIIPGGGPTDKSIEAIDREAPLARDTHHRACALAQDQTGLIICDSAFGRSLRPCDNLEEARNIARGGATPVLLPSRIMFAVDPFERSWEITSDAIAIWFAWLVGAPGAVILTDVDGILDPAAGAEGRLIRKILASDLVSWNATAVDVCTPHLARSKQIMTWVVNGSVPARLLHALRGDPSAGTLIEPS